MTDEKTKMVVQQQPSDKPIMPFESLASFEDAQRVAKALMSSDLVPNHYRGNMGNCLIAMEMSTRTGASMLAVLQNLNVIHGRPSWGSSYCIAAINQSGRFKEPLDFEFQGEENTDKWGCRAVTVSNSGRDIRGPLVTIGMAKAEGWFSRKSKSGQETSKWQTMPELMLRYRAAAFFARTVCPDLLMGLQTDEEVRDVIDVTGDRVDDSVPDNIFETVREKPQYRTVFADKDMEVVTKETEDNKDKEVAAEGNEERVVIDDGRPENVALKTDKPEWPKYDDDLGSWVDSDGVTYSPEAHAGYKVGEIPIVNADGSFKARRGATHKAKALKEKVIAARNAEVVDAEFTEEQQPEPPKDEIPPIGEARQEAQEEPKQEKVDDTIPEIEEPETQESVQPDVEDSATSEEPDEVQAWRLRLRNAKTMDDLLKLEEEIKGFDTAYSEQCTEQVGERYRDMVDNGELG